MTRGFEVKTYIVQKACGEIVGVKLTFAAAKALEKAQAPARVIPAVADKSEARNVAAPERSQRPRN